MLRAGTRRLKVLHVISSLSRQCGGPSRSSQGLVAALCQAGVDAWIYPIDGTYPWVKGVRKYEKTLSVQTIGEFDLVHIHGIWSWALHRVVVMCRKAGVAYVIAPRGMLEPWSLKQKGIKKRFARLLYQDRDLKTALALHATAESEAEQFRRLGFKNKIIISPNGVNVPDHTLSTKHQALSTDEKRRALFVSRMHPKKGVMELVEAWSKVGEEETWDLLQWYRDHSVGSPVQKEVPQCDDISACNRKWLCELVYTTNSDYERDYEIRVKQRVHELGLDQQFVFTGPLDDEKKWDAYGRADLFILPTYSENFGIVIAEALWAGVPAITTKGTPWSDLVNAKCGWWIDLPKDGAAPADWPSLLNAIREAMASPCLALMGQRGRQFVEEHYTWRSVCDKLIRGYEEALNGRA